MFALCVALAIAGLFVGPALALFGRGRPKLGAALDGATLGLVPCLLIVRTLPHLYDEVGWGAVALMVGGYLGLLVLEARSHGTTAGVGIAVVVPALAIHSFVDGAALAVAFSAEASVSASLLLAAALVFHKVPEGLFFASTLMPRLGFPKTLRWVALLAAGTLSGALIGRELLAHVPDAVLHALVAVGLGVMLRLVLHRHDVTLAGARSERAIGGASFLLALVLALLVPSPGNVLTRAQPHELSVTGTLSPLFVETAPALVIGLIARAFVRAALADRHAYARLRVTAIRLVRDGQLDVGLLAFSWIVLGARLTLLRFLVRLVVAREGGRSRVQEQPQTTFGKRFCRQLAAAATVDFDRPAARYVLALVSAGLLEAALDPRAVQPLPLEAQVAAAVAAGMVVGGGHVATLLVAILLHKGLDPRAAVLLLLVAESDFLRRGRAAWSAASARALVGCALVTALGVAVGVGEVPELHRLATHRHRAEEWLSAGVVFGLLTASVLRLGPRDWARGLFAGEPKEAFRRDE